MWGDLYLVWNFVNHYELLSLTGQWIPWRRRMPRPCSRAPDFCRTPAAVCRRWSSSPGCSTYSAGPGTGHISLCPLLGLHKQMSQINKTCLHLTGVVPLVGGQEPVIFHRVLYLGYTNKCHKHINNHVYMQY